MKRFRRVYLHIGMGKTGSTAIQQVLYHNAGWLASEHDIHYPVEPVVSQAKDRRGNHSQQLSCMFHPQPEKLKLNLEAGRGNHKAASDYADGLRRAFEEGFRDSNATCLMLSAEGIPTYHARALPALAAWLRDWCDDIIVVACLRHPAQALSSHIQQHLRNGGTLQQLYAKPPFYPYRSLLPRIEAAFSVDRLRVYDFADAVADPNGLANRLLREMGLDFVLPETPADTPNTSMSQAAAYMVDSLNRLYPRFIEDHPNKKRRGDAFRIAYGIAGSKYRAPTEVFDRLIDECTPHLQWLEQHYGVSLGSSSLDFASDPEPDRNKIDRAARKLYWIGRAPKRLRRYLHRLLGQPTRVPGQAIENNQRARV